MTEDDLQKRDEKKIAAAMGLLVTGLLFVLVGVLWPAWLNAQFGAGWRDFARGAAFGVGIGLQCGGVVAAMAAARRHGKIDG